MRRSFRKISLITALMMAVTPSVVAGIGSGSLSGTVMSSEGRGLIGAVVVLLSLDDRGSVVSLTKSDQRGTYSLSDIAAGSYALRASRNGYQVLTSPHVTVKAGRTTTINLVLQDLLDFVSVRDDPRNWDMKTVMRSTSDRRMIFRDLPGINTADEQDRLFSRNGALHVASSTLLSGGNFASSPNQGDADIYSNFAYAEPLSQHSRMIFSGQLTSGYDLLWRVRNSFDYHPDPGRKYRFSAGYGRFNLNRLSAGTMARPEDFFRRDPVYRDTGVETITVGMQASNEFLKALAVAYGFDFSRIRYGTAKNIWSPYFQLMLTPYRGWLVKTMLTSRRISDNNTVQLPDGETINLLEPAFITKIDNGISISQVKHAEMSLARKVTDDASLEVTVYRDRTEGPGTPFVMTYMTGSGKKSYTAQLRSDQDEQQGLRVAFARMLMESLRGSITYNYSTAAALAAPDSLLSGDMMASRLLDFVHRACYHSITSQLAAKIPQTRTQLQATVRWYPGTPISPIDLFADRSDTFTKGMSFSLKQVLPLPDFMGSAGQWEAQIDLRNAFNQGRSLLPTTDGEFSLTRNPRTLRFGLNLSFN
jgi:hypothetical protein